MNDERPQSPDTIGATSNTLPDGADHAPDSADSTALPLLAWLLIQLIALSLPALQVRFSARFPLPAEHMALDEMLVAQFAASAMLFPFLLRSARTTAMATMSGWMFVTLAGFLSAQMNPWKIVAGALVLSSWLIGLGLWRNLLGNQRRRLIGVAVATSLTLGGPLLWYLHAEFETGNASVNWRHDGIAGPLMAAMAVIHRGPFTQSAWAFTGAYFLISAVAWLILRAMRRHAVLH